MRRIQIEPSSTRWLLGAVALLIVIMAAGYFQWIRLHEARTWVFHTRQVILSVERLLSEFRAAESAQRGYLLVNRPQYLASYQAERQAALEGARRLEQLLAGDVAQGDRMAGLRQVLDQKLAELDQSLDLLALQNRDAAIALAETDRGRMLMQEVERMLDKIREAESKTLESRIILEQASSNAALTMLSIGGSILLVLLIAASIRINGQIRRQRSLLAAAAGQVAELARSNEELQRFAFVTSHDLQEPLRIISSYSTLLTRLYKGKLDAQGDEFLHYIVTHADRMQALIRDLLDYSRTGKRSEHMTRISA
ncbi:MAG: CHASE3 domain-containing protein, partial [Acidobacteria bacterium]|nr:CHASE3 domain-containing protein [Acidobacteriota bacterium]